MTCKPPENPLSDEQKSRIYGVIAVGCDWQTAANLVGCSVSDMRREMHRDSQFAEQVRRSEASAELSHMRTIQKAIEDPKNWRTSVWWLERHAPERFARNAGAITARQLKLFLTILADVLIGDGQCSLTPEELLSRLDMLADSIDQLLCSESAPGAEGILTGTPHPTLSNAGDVGPHHGNTTEVETQ